MAKTSARGGKPGILGPAPGRSGASALLVTRDGRYLMQRRDRSPEATFPDHWCCFGGGIEPGESPIEGLRRELREEIGFALRSAKPFTQLAVVLPFAEPKRDNIVYFAVPIRVADIAGLTVKEGAGMALFRAAELVLQDKIAPWDLAAVLMHARRATLFPERA